MEVRKDFNVIVGKKLIEKRKELGYSQQKFCEEIGINLSAYKHYELGQRSVSIELLMKISDYYKINIGSLFLDGSEESAKMFHYMNKYRATMELRKNESLSADAIFNEPNINIPEKIKEIRLNNKKTQQEISDIIGIDISTYNKYEKGTRSPNIEMLYKIANAYNLSVEELIK